MPEGTPPTETRELGRELFVVLWLTVVAAALGILGVILYTTCDPQYQTGPFSVVRIVCSDPYTSEAYLAFYLMAMVICVGIARPTRPSSSFPNDAWNPRIAAVFLGLALTGLFVLFVVL